MQTRSKSSIFIDFDPQARPVNQAIERSIDRSFKMTLFMTLMLFCFNQEFSPQGHGENRTNEMSRCSRISWIYCSWLIPRSGDAIWSCTLPHRPTPFSIFAPRDVIICLKFFVLLFPGILDTREIGRNLDCVSTHKRQVSQLVMWIPRN